MIKLRSEILASFLVVLIAVVAGMKAQNLEQQGIIRDAKSAKAAFIEEDPEMAKIFANAEGYVIFPNVGKGAYVVGAAAGNRVV